MASDRCMPLLGLSVATDHAVPLSTREVRLLARLTPEHLRADVELGLQAPPGGCGGGGGGHGDECMGTVQHGPEWCGALARVTLEADALGCGIELAVHVQSKMLQPNDAKSNTWTPSDENRTDGMAKSWNGAAITLASRAELDLLCAALHLSGTSIARVLVFEHVQGRGGPPAMTSPGAVMLVRDTLGDILAPETIVAGGSDGWFADINRDRPDREALHVMQAIAFPASPTVHLADDASVVENIGGLKETATFAHLFRVLLIAFWFALM